MSSDRGTPPDRTDFLLTACVRGADGNDYCRNMHQLVEWMKPGDDDVTIFRRGLRFLGARMIRENRHALPEALYPEEV